MALDWIVKIKYYQKVFDEQLVKSTLGEKFKHNRLTVVFNNV